jgi:hypothetical protein
MKKPHSKKFQHSRPKKKKFYKKAQEKKREPLKFPSIPRIIPEVSFSSLKKVVWNKYFMVSFVATFISVAVIMQGFELTGHIRELQMIRSEREQVRGEIAYWEGIVKMHEDYRDGYFKLALLEYRLGNKEKAREYIDRTLLIDPNYKAAHEFEDKIEGK